MADLMWLEVSVMLWARVLTRKLYHSYLGVAPKKPYNRKTKKELSGSNANPTPF